jgi:hypothetical protein
VPSPRDRLRVLLVEHHAFVWRTLRRLEGICGHRAIFLSSFISSKKRSCKRKLSVSR